MKLAATLFAGLCGLAASRQVPVIPATFEADVVTTVPFLPTIQGHMWFDNATLQTRTDFSQFGAKASVYQDGFNCTETTITTMFGQQTCEVAFLQNPMHPYDIPFFATFVGDDNLNGHAVEHWSFKLGFDIASITFDFFVDTRPSPNELVRVLLSTPFGMDIKQDFDNFHAAPGGFAPSIWEIPHGICPEPKCASELDIVLLLDGSGSVSDTDFGYMKEFSTHFVNIFDMSDHSAAISVVQFSNSINVANNLSTNKSSVIDAIQRMRQIGSGTDTAKGLNEARSQLTDRSWRNAPKTVVLLTDGASNNPSATRSTAQSLKDQGITIFTVGIGPGINLEEVYDVATPPAEFHSFTPRTFQDLIDAVDAIAGVTCGSAGGGCVVA